MPAVLLHVHQRLLRLPLPRLSCWLLLLRMLLPLHLLHLLLLLQASSWLLLFLLRLITQPQSLKLLCRLKLGTPPRRAARQQQLEPIRVCRCRAEGGRQW